MNYAGIKYNDIVDGEGITVSLWTVGCPHRCKGCHNSNLWEYSAGVPLPADIRGRIIKAISENGIQRNFSVLGGEPLCKENLAFVTDIIKAVRMAYPSIKIYLWTGYSLEELKDRISQGENKIEEILLNIDTLIDGRFILDEKDLNLHLRGSKNQRILKKGIDF